MTEVNNVTQTTDEYSKFKFLKHNRRILHNHVLHLMKSIDLRPHLGPARPILVNEKFEVIDGQHSLEARKRLKTIVYYMIVKGLTIADARILNALQRTWSLIDYAESFASEGHKEYQLFLELQDQYKLPAAALVILMTNHQYNDIRIRFKTGEFIIGKREEIQARLDKLEDFSEAVKTWRESAFMMAVWNLLKIDGYDHERMMKKLGGGITVLRQPDRMSYLRELEDIYNRDIPMGSRTRFF